VHSNESSNNHKRSPASQSSQNRHILAQALTVLVAPGLSDRLLRATNSVQGAAVLPKLRPSWRSEGAGLEAVALPCSVAWSVAGRRSLRQVRRWACFDQRSIAPGGLRGLSLQGSSACLVSTRFIPNAELLFRASPY
jgi:hypothetical protein